MNQMEKVSSGQPSKVAPHRPINISRLFFEILLAIVLSETAIMFILPEIAPNASKTTGAFLDTAILTLTAGSVILWRCRKSDTAVSDLKLQTELLSHIVNNIPCCIFWKDRESVYLGCNDQFARLAGFTDAAQVIGKTDYDMPWTENETFFYRQCDMHILETNQPMLDIEETLQGPDGSVKTILTSKVPLRNAANEAYGVLSIFQDISHRKRADDVLRTRLAAIDAAADMVVITSRDGTIEYVNPAFTATTGYSFAEAIGKKPSTLKSGVHGPQFYTDLWSTVLSGKIWQGELVNRRKDGTTYPEEMTITPVLNSRGEVIRFVAIKRDITQRKQAQSIEQEHAMLRESIKSMEQVLGIVGHELRTPLAGIRVISEFLLTNGARQSEECDSLIVNLHEEAMHMTNTVDGLLEAARLNSGRAQWHWDTVTIRDIVEDAIHTIEPLVDQKKVELAFDITPEELTMQGDSDALRRMIVNFLTNAQKHTTSGSIHVTAQRVDDAADQWIEIQIRDTGKGIPPHLASKLGEAFALNHGVVGINQVSGTGLGLAICKGIAAAHGGGLQFHSIEGQGTTVTARLRADLAEAVHGEGKVEFVAEEKV